MWRTQESIDNEHAAMNLLRNAGMQGVPRPSGTPSHVYQGYYQQSQYAAAPGHYQQPQYAAPPGHYQQQWYAAPPGQYQGVQYPMYGQQPQPYNPYNVDAGVKQLEQRRWREEAALPELEQMRRGLIPAPPPVPDVVSGWTGHGRTIQMAVQATLNKAYVESEDRRRIEEEERERRRRREHAREYEANYEDGRPYDRPARRRGRRDRTPSPEADQSTAAVAHNPTRVDPQGSQEERRAYDLAKREQDFILSMHKAAADQGVNLSKLKRY